MIRTIYYFVGKHQNGKRLTTKGRYLRLQPYYILYIYRFFGPPSRTHGVAWDLTKKQNTTKRLLRWCVCYIVLLLKKKKKKHRIVIYVEEKNERADRHTLRACTLASCWFLCA